MVAAYEGLPAQIKQEIADRQAVHSYLPRFNASRQADVAFKENKFDLSDAQKAELAEVSHPVVRTHPESGRKALFVNEGFTVRIEGASDDEKGWLAQLNEHATQDKFIYRHRWSAGDVVFWDNRVVMHCATEYDRQYARRMHRTTVQGDVPY